MLFSFNQQFFYDLSFLQHSTSLTSSDQNLPRNSTLLMYIFYRIQKPCKEILSTFSSRREMSMEKWKKQNANDTGKMFEFRNWGINEKGIHNKQQEEKMEKCIYYIVYYYYNEN